MEYTCRICGRQHTIYFGVKGENSSEIRKLTQASTSVIHYDKEKGIYFIDNTLVVLPAVLLIPTAYHTPLWFVTWVEVDQSLYTAIEDDQTVIECRMFENLPPYYDHAKGLRCSIEHLPDEDNKPLITITEDSPLRTDQQKGLSKAALIRLMDVLHHDKIYTGRVGRNLEDIYLDQLAARIELDR
jgi:hypothetical protein